MTQAPLLVATMLEKLTLFPLDHAEFALELDTFDLHPQYAGRGQQTGEGKITIGREEARRLFNWIGVWLHTS